MNSIPSSIPLKQCSKCPNSYPASPEFFERDKYKKDGLSPTCKVCRKIYQAVYNSAHVEYRKQYYMEHKEEIRIKRKQERDANKEAISRKKAQYLENNKERINQKKRLDRKLHPERFRLTDRSHKHKRKALKRALQGSYTAQQLQEQMQRQKSKCYYCKTKLGNQWHADHVVPLSRGGSNTIDNIVIACPGCNMRKHDKLLHEWAEGGRLL